MHKVFLFTLFIFLTVPLCAQITETPVADGALPQSPESPAADGALPQIAETPAVDGALSQDAETPAADGALLQDAETPVADGALPQIAESLEVDGALSQDAETPALLHQELELPGLEKEATEKFRQMYLKPEWQKLLKKYLEDGVEYRLYVRKALKDADMPSILEYLPVVESNYNPKAKSKSGALGLWQFMENSVQPFLDLNDFVDQRLDPWDSTNAAIKKLKDNYNFFGDWTLAIAAYNCGAGAMAKALKKSPVKDFWYLAENNLIPKQTAEYIPKLIAIADVAVNSEYYKIDIPLHTEDYELLEEHADEHYDFVTVNRAYSLSQLASEMKISNSLMKRLNPSYLLEITHPSKESKIRLPLGMGETAKSVISKMTTIDFPVKYKVVAGDSLWSISRKYNVKISTICELNGINENDILRIGKILYIPKK